MANGASRSLFWDPVRYGAGYYELLLLKGYSLSRPPLLRSARIAQRYAPYATNGEWLMANVDKMNKE